MQLLKFALRSSFMLSEQSLTSTYNLDKFHLKSCTIHPESNPFERKLCTVKTVISRNLSFHANFLTLPGYSIVTTLQENFQKNNEL